VAYVTGIRGIGVCAIVFVGETLKRGQLDELEVDRA
jgi:hypothetical protein